MVQWGSRQGVRPTVAQLPNLLARWRGEAPSVEVTADGSTHPGYRVTPPHRLAPDGSGSALCPGWPGEEGEKSPEQPQTKEFVAGTRRREALHGAAKVLERSTDRCRARRCQARPALGNRAITFLRQ